MKNILTCLAVFLACGLVIAGCRDRKEEAAAPATKAGADKAVASTRGDSMAARVNGTTISGAEVDQAVNILLSQYGGQIPPEQKAGIQPIMRKQAIESLINQSLLLQEADREGIRPDKKAIDDQMKQISARFPNSEAFQKLLASQGISEEQLRQDIGKDLKIQALLDKKTPTTPDVSDADIAAFYKDNPDNFKMPERVRASHILLTFSPADNDEVKSQKRQRLLSLKAELEKGADFAKLASENSDCPSKAQGGDLGLFEKGKMVKPFEDAAFAMKAGQVSDVVESQFGYHLIKVTGKEDAKAVPIEEAREKIASFLNQEKKQKAVGEYLQKLRSAAKVEYGANG